MVILATDHMQNRFRSEDGMCDEITGQIPR